MENPEPIISALKDALRAAPDNHALRLHLAQVLLQHNLPADAEKESRLLLSADPASTPAKLALAEAFFRQSKNSAASVIIEELLKQRDIPAKTYILHAKLLARAGDIERAITQYKRGIESDPTVADPEFADQFGITPSRQTSFDQDQDTREVVDGKIRNATTTPDSAAESLLERPTISFADVGGMDPIKDEIRMKIIHPLNHAEMYKAYGKSIGGGILMYGPPGCGKTFLARATAGEINAHFISVGIHDVLDMWLGNSEKNLHSLFATARKNNPCVLFFDEVDALAASRADMRTSAGRHLINQFLAEMDGVKNSNEGLLILAATNAPWHVDAAFRRPGRFDQVLFIPPPDAVARQATLELLLAKKPIEKNLPLDQVAKKTEGFSGADLKALVDAAIDIKLRQAMKDGTPQPIGIKDLLAAAAKIKPSTAEWFTTARNYALYSNQGGMYDDIVRYLKL